MAQNSTSSNKLIVFVLAEPDEKVIRVDDFVGKLRRYYEVIEPKNPEEAINQAIFKNPKLLILFVDMSKDNGVEFLKKLRSQESRFETLVKRSKLKVLVLATVKGAEPPEYKELGIWKCMFPPYKVPALLEAIKEYYAEGETRKVLIINNREEEIAFFKDFFSSQGYESLLAKNLSEGWELLKENSPFSALVDTEIDPGVDPSEVIKKLHTSYNIQHILVTTTPEKVGQIIPIGELEISSEFGIYDYFTKPYDVEKLLSSVQVLKEKALQSKYFLRPSSVPEGKAEEISLPLLVVESSDKDREKIKNLLNEIGCSTFNVESTGLESLSLVSEDTGLILFDWGMSEMSGEKFLELLKKKGEPFNKIPVIMVIRKEDKGKVIEGLTSGAQDYLLKPIDKEALKEKIEKFARG